MGLFSSIGKSLSKSFGSFAKGFKSNPIGSILGATGLPQSSAQIIPGGEFLQSGFQNIGEGMQDFWDSYTGRDIAMKNYELQKDQFEYQQRLNTEQQAREDNAMQRKVADLKAAGLNPVLAANGTGAASAPLKAAPAPQIENTSGAMRETLNNAFQGILQVMSMKKDFAQKDAQIQLLRTQRDDVIADMEKKKAETEGLKIDNQFRSETLTLRNESLALDNALKSGTLNNKIALSAVELDHAKVNLYNSQLDSLCKKLDITRKDIDIELARIDVKYKDNIYQAELAAKSVAVAKSIAEYNSYIWDVDYWHNTMHVPVGFNIPREAADLQLLTEKVANIFSAIGKGAKTVVGSEGFNQFINSLVSGGKATMETVNKIASKIGISPKSILKGKKR